MRLARGVLYIVWVPDEPVQQGNWMTVKCRSHGSKHCSSVLIKTLNRFSPLIDAPTEKPDESALVIGDYIVWDMKIETLATIVHCLPGGRSPDILANLKVLANAKRRFSKIVIHVDANDVRLRQSEITKNNVKEVCELANTMSDTVICSLLTGAMRFIANCCHSMAECLSRARRITWVL